VHLSDMSLKMKRPPPSDSEIEEAFEKLDKNKDSKISSEEMKGILDEIEKFQQAKSNEAFTHMDENGDGVLSRVN
jgi:Ca2+-binding EF-hand superfamily protein